jgi:SAM-dependent methyltransferase
LISNAAKRLPAPIVNGLRAWVSKRRERAISDRISALVAISEWQTPPCAICGDNKVTPHKTCNGFQIVRCQNDGLIFVSPRPKDLTAFYDERYYTGQMPGVYSDYEIDSEQSKPSWQERLIALERMLGGPRELLDIGCATGEFLKLARSAGWQVSGLEMSEWAVAKARSANALTVTQGSLPDTRLPSAAYDAVTLWDCIEHLAEPRAVLLDVHRILKDDGVLMLSTGVVKHEDPDLRSQWYYPPWHLYYFSERTIRELLAECGFTVVSYVEQGQDVPEYTLMVVMARPTIHN